MSTDSNSNATGALVLMPTAGRAEPESSPALRLVGGLPLVVHALHNLLAARTVSHVLVAVAVSAADPVRAALAAAFPDGVPALVHADGDGGPDALPAAYARLRELDPAAGAVLVHDVARAFAPPALIDRVAQAVLAGATSVAPVLPCSDTVKTLDQDGLVTGTPDRAFLRVGQTPRGFAAEAFARACAEGTLPALLRGPATAVPGEPDARRLSTPLDLALAEAALADRTAEETTR